jgi:hypothetical protein
MAGNTGKLTREAVIARGPRMALVRHKGQLIIFRQGVNPFSDFGRGGSVLAQSYSLAYLLKVGRGQSIKP